ncbi:MAG: ZIP family metal transporter [Pseudodesulfovibrio sp.]|nr:ZIP family metal transporter [Pseudodesulfovibrio sp.]
MDYFQTLSPLTQAFLATLFTWGMTAMGAAVVFLAKDISKRVLDIMLGFAGGVMIAASYWSLLAPAIEMSEHMGVFRFVPAAAGFLMGAVFLRLVDMFLPHLHINAPRSEAEGVDTNWNSSILLVLAITLHNIPEGLAVGVAFGAVAAGFDSATMGGAIALAIGIGIQNFPEGTAVSVPLRRQGFSRLKSFMYGQASGIVEPIAAVIGAAAVFYAKPLLPYALAFAAGAMIFVVVEEVIPESQASGYGDQATMGCIFGFTIMMILDVALS